MYECLLKSQNVFRIVYILESRYVKTIKSDACTLIDTHTHTHTHTQINKKLQCGYYMTHTFTSPLTHTVHCT